MLSLYQQTISDLKDCYNAHADKFSSTRKKHRPEFERIAQKIGKYLSQDNIGKTLSFYTGNQETSLLELGCGDGRLYPYLINQDICIDQYTGVDISSELINKAQIHSPSSESTQRIVDDMLHYLTHRPSESENIIICIASFQHIPDQHTRSEVLKEIYRVLKYNGIFITIDWSWSQRMLYKHRKPLLQSILKSFGSFGKRERNNLLIPFTHQDLTHYRLYHIFTQKELQRLYKTQGFIIKEMIYSSQDGSFHHNWKQARNICSIAQKNIFNEEKTK